MLQFFLRSRLFLFALAMAGVLLFGAAHWLQTGQEDWGFFGHKKINRMAVFTLPPEMIGFFKSNLEYVTEHAVDPDKRRYATKHEGVRHYIDIDHHGEAPFPNLPRDWAGALGCYTNIFLVHESDTLHLSGPELFYLNNDDVVFTSKDLSRLLKADSLVVNLDVVRSYFKEYIIPQYYQDEWTVEPKTLSKLFGEDFKPDPKWTVAFQDELSPYGIIPYHLEGMYYKLVDVFQSGDTKAILRHCTDFGHYIGDAHVPLHTTTNYNGQLTNQIGIHAFWESRIVELFSNEYDYFVGSADYIDNPREFFWETVLTSHSLVDSVLNIEKRLSKTFPQDQQFCFEERLDITIRTQCKDFARAYSNELKGMVEDRFTSSIKALGSVWFSAWVDAGQPNLRRLDPLDTAEGLKDEEIEKKFKGGKIIGRKHEG